MGHQNRFGILLQKPRRAGVTTGSYLQHSTRRAGHYLPDHFLRYHVPVFSTQ